MDSTHSPADLLNGSIQVGTVPVAIVDSPTRFYSGVLFLNDSADAVICIGANPNVRADLSHAACGFPIPPKASVVIPISDLSRLYAVATDVPARLFYLGC